MIQESGSLHPSAQHGRGDGRTPPLWFHRLTYTAGAPVLLALLGVALLLLLPVPWSFEPPAIRRILSFLFDILGPLLAASFLAVRYQMGGETYWLLLGMGTMAWGAAGFANAMHLPGDSLDTGMTIIGTSSALCGILSLAAVPLAYKPPKERSSRKSLVALAIGYGGVLVVVTLVTWAKLVGEVPPFYLDDIGSTMLRRGVLSIAVLTLTAAAALLYLIGFRRHPLALRWYALGLALLAIGSWGQANVEDIWGLLAWTSRAVNALGVIYLVLGSVLATRETHAEPRVPLAALLQSEAEFRAFFENAGVGAAQIDPDFNFIRVNDRYCEITGYSREELLGRSPLDITHPDDREADHARIARLFAHPDTTYDAEKRYLHKEGHTLWVHITISLVRDALGEPLHTVAVVEDITERVREERRARRYTRVVAAINSILSEVVRAETEEEVGHACLAVALEITESALGFIGEVRADGRLYDIAISEMGLERCAISNANGHRGAPGGLAIAGLHRHLLAGATSFFTNEPSAHPAAIGTPEGHPPLTSFLGVPLFQQDKVVGVLVVGNREGGYTLEQQADLDKLAPAVAQALWKKRAEQELRQHLLDLEALDRTNKTLLGEINHRVKNNLSAIIGLLYAEQRRLRAETPPSCELVLDDLSERIRNLAAAHTLLSAGGWRPLRLSELAEEVIAAAAPLSMGKRPLTIEVDSSPVSVTPGQAHHLALVIGELVMNTLKYARGEELLKIKVGITLEQDMVRMVYCDNGPGYPEAVLSGDGRSVGLGLLGTIVTTSLRGSWFIRNDRGAVTEVSFPVVSDTNGDNTDEPQD
jgi:PAS domain S-box-containing protein